MKQAPADKCCVRGCFYDWCIREADGSIAVDDDSPQKESSKKKKSKAKQKTKVACEPRNDEKPTEDAKAQVDATIADEALVTPMRMSRRIKSKSSGMMTSSECTNLAKADATAADSSSSDMEDGENVVTKQKTAKLNQGVSKLLMVHYNNSSIGANQLFHSYSTSLPISANLFQLICTYCIA